MAAQPERTRRPAVSEAPGNGGPEEAASYIVNAAADLGRLARRHGLDTLGFLLDMAQMEAEEIVRLGLSRDRDRT